MCNHLCSYLKLQAGLGMSSIFRFVSLCAVVLQLVACGLAPLAPDSRAVQSPWALSSIGSASAKEWTHYKLPGKTPSQFEYELTDGRDAIAATAHSSASMLRQVMKVEPAALGRIKFSWKLPDLIEYADMSQREFDDSPVRVVLAFEGDRSTFSGKNAMLSELAHVLTGEPMPYATLMYVWCNTCELETVIFNPHTDRIRKLPLESGRDKLNRWMDYERAVRDDFVKAFGEEPGTLTSISIMTDTDNTKSVTRAWYGAVSLTSAVGK